jgi:hypothetical protein
MFPDPGDQGRTEGARGVHRGAAHRPAPHRVERRRGADQARESCPFWPGQPVLAHWGTEDPAAYVGTPRGQLQAFRKAAAEIYRRIDLFRNLPLSALSRLQTEQETARIGQRTGARGQGGRGGGIAAPTRRR